MQYESKNVLAIEIVNVCTVEAYFQPNTEVHDIVEELVKCVSRLESSKEILYGEFNCRMDDGTRDEELSEVSRRQGCFSLAIRRLERASTQGVGPVRLISFSSALPS